MSEPGEARSEDAAGGASGDSLLSREPFRSAPDDWFVFDRSGHIVDVNTSALEHLGYARDELIGLGVWEISTRQTEAGFRRLVAALESEGHQSLFGQSRRKDGSFYSVEVRLWITELGGASHVFAAMRDSRGHQELIEERDQLISLIENSAEAITVATSEGICSYMNPEGRALLGLRSLEDVAGKPLADLHPKDHAQLLEEVILPSVRRGHWNGELTYRRHDDGREKPCWVNAFAIKHSQRGEVIGLALMAHDISERKQAELHRQRLLELNEVSRNVATSLLEHDDLGRAIEIILRGAGTILKVSRAYLCRYREERAWVFRTHQWGVSAGLGATDGACAVTPRPESAEGYSWVTSHLAKGEAIRITDVSNSGIIPRSGSGVLRPDVKAILLIPVIIHGRLESFFGFVDTETTREWEDEELAILQIIVDSFGRAIERRIAERERSEIARDLERSVARERSANRYKSEFLANMSHEIRTPMNAIVGYAELLSRPNVDPEKRDLWSAHIRRSTGYLLSLINDVLDLSKIEAGQMRIATEPASVSEMVSTVYDLLRGQAAEKLIDFRVEYDGPVPEQIETDPVRLRQILVNLVGNAIKFTEEGSVVLRVTTEGFDDRHALDSQRPVALGFSVIDTGIGIDPTNLERLFRPFSQVHSLEGVPFGGTGLGLVIARQLAGLLGGEITVESEVGKGSTFSFALPLAGTRIAMTSVADAPSIPEPPRGVVSLAGYRILIVDDSQENRDVLAFLLTESGCTVETANNGSHGIECVWEAERAGSGFDLVLMDVNMPVLDGHAAARRLVDAGFEKPIIALTALTLEGDERRCREAGCVDYIAKPVRPTKFLEKLHRHLNAREDAGEVDPAPAAASEPEYLGPVLVNNPRFQPLVDRYVASFPGLCDEIDTLRAAEDFESLRTRVHRLRGTAANYGFPEISRSAGRCEDLIRGGAEAAELDAGLAELVGHLRAKGLAAGDA